MDKTKLSIEIVTPDGTVLREADVDEVVLRRLEGDFEKGSEVAIFPKRGPMMARIPIAALRYHDHGRWHYVAVAGGSVEVKNNRVRVVSASCELTDPDDPDSAERSRELADEWHRTSSDGKEGLVGFHR